ncbi:hypothetical protein ISF_07966 [Cordyceps fumosorosea ARSEF 2679]|uniref:Clr5 domain-containing protein n=1 Tax=Cordyceps fumosorosea (strain ARSEF 2679) TaxID=1081104 RepID=A0A162ID42_CORFA|nr:hypothetical protein ISF_07966 [Cordyceps fumosorosea ARSEF 2679]OAA55455.1 hypothetical protein ISF_07966 [Cordyceps fumosorosea ARSEF 2679]
MFDHESDKARASGFALDAYGNMNQHTYFHSGDDFGSIAPSQLARLPDDMHRMDSHAMDWTPTPTGHGSHFRNQNTFNDQEDLIDFDEITTSQPEVSGVGRLVAQFEHRDYVPPLPPRPIINTAPSPAETDPSLTNSSLSSYFSSFASTAHANQAPSPVGSPVESHYGSFGDVLSRITSPPDLNSMGPGSPLIGFETFPNVRIASPHISVVRSHVAPGFSRFQEERARTPVGGEPKSLPNNQGLDADSHMFGDVERNILTFLKPDIDTNKRQQSLQPTRQDPQQMLHANPQMPQQMSFVAAHQVNQQLNRQLSNRQHVSTPQPAQSNQSRPPMQPSQPFQPNQPTQQTQTTTQPSQTSQPIDSAQQLHHQLSRQDSQSTQPQQTSCSGAFGSAAIPGTPGFSIWRPPSPPNIKQEPSPDSPSMFSRTSFEKPPVPPKPKPIQEAHQITLDFNAAAKDKGKAPVKPPKPPKPLRSKLQPPQQPPRPQLDTGIPITTPSSEKVAQTPATPATPTTPSTTADVTSPGPSALRQAVSALRGHGLRPGRELVPAEVWEHHKPTIRSLYLDDRKPLKEVMGIMAEKYNFQATPKMYKTRFSQWGFAKNNTEDEVKRLLGMKFQRDAEGKISEFVRNGRVVNLGTYLKRKGVTEYDLIDFEQPVDLPAHIRCRTPTPPPPPIYFHTPELVRAQEVLVSNIRKALLQCRQFETEVGTQVGWTVVQTWGAWSSEILLEANFFFEALDTDTGGQCLMRAFKQLEEDLKTLSPLGIFELLTGMANRDLGLVSSLCKYLAAHSTTNLDRNHPLRLIFNCLYEVQQNHGAAVLSELLWGCSPLFANELEAIYGRRHPYVVRAWLDLAYFNNHINFDRLQKIAVELRAVQKQLEQKNGETEPEVLIVRYALLQLMYATEPKSDNTKHATTELWATLKSMKVLCRIRDTKSNAYCYHSPVRLSPWTKRCRRRYDAAMAIFEDHLGVKLHPYFEEDLHTSLHELESSDSWVTGLELSGGGSRLGYI